MWITDNIIEVKGQEQQQVEIITVFDLTPFEGILWKSYHERVSVPFIISGKHSEMYTTTFVIS